MSVSTAPTDSVDPSRLYRLAARSTLAQAEALLTAYRADEPNRDPATGKQLARWGRDVLTSTRLLIDSPAGDDPQLRALFNDLELVLAQIVRLPPRAAAPDVYLIDQTLDQREVLPRLRELLADNSISQP